MQGWALGVVCLYVGLALFHWVTGSHWLAEAAWPLSILAGLGLAIASTPSSTTTLPAASQSPGDGSAADASPPEHPEHPDLATDIAATALDPALPHPPSPQATPPTEPSISFTIHKTVRPNGTQYDL